MVALESAVRHLEGRNAICRDLLGCLAEGQSLGLREEVCHQQIVVGCDRIQRLVESDKVARDQLRALVNELVEGMLAVGAWLPPDNGAGLIINGLAFEIDMLTIALHIELLEI